LRKKNPKQQVVLRDVLDYPDLAESIGKEFCITNIETVRTLMSEAVFEYENREWLNKP